MLSEKLIANENIPRHNVAFYDGYALRSDDTRTASAVTPVKLKVTKDFSLVEDENKTLLGCGEAVYISSGSLLPIGADAVVRREKVYEETGEIVLNERVEPGDAVIHVGDDLRKGEEIYPEGYLIRPHDIGLMIKLGCKRVRVYRKPIAMFLSTRHGENEGPDGTTLSLMGLLRSIGIETVYKGEIGLDREKTAESLKKASTKGDFIVTVGGTSKGKEDCIPETAREIGRLLFHGVNMSPGKVFGFALLNNKPLFIVPGFIGSAIASTLTFIVPMISKLLIKKFSSYLTLKACLMNSLKSKPDKYAFKLLKTCLNSEGEHLAYPINKVMGGSSIVSSITQANSFALLPPNIELEKGSIVKVYFFKQFEPFDQQKNRGFPFLVK